MKYPELKLEGDQWVDIGATAAKNIYLCEVLSSQANAIPIVVNAPTLQKESLDLAIEFMRRSLCLGAGKENCSCKECLYISTYKTHPRATVIAEGFEVGLTRDTLDDLYIYSLQQPLKRVLIVENIDKLHSYSQQALLKILEAEELNLNTIILTSDIEAVPATILSRCQIYNLVHNYELSKRIAETRGIKFLTKSKKAHSLEDSMLAMRLACCSPYKWQSYITGAKGIKRLKETANDVLNAIKAGKTIRLLKLLLSPNTAEITENLMIYSSILEDIAFLRIGEWAINRVTFKELWNNSALAESDSRLGNRIFMAWQAALEARQTILRHPQINKNILIYRTLQFLLLD